MADIWLIYGLYMAYIWFIYGLYMPYIGLVYGESMDNLWIWLVVSTPLLEHTGWFIGIPLLDYHNP